MDRAEANRRIIHSRRVLHGWQAVPPAGPIEDTLGMIRDELAILAEIGAAFPAKAGTIGLLAQDWKSFAESLRMKAD